MVLRDTVFMNIQPQLQTCGKYLNILDDQRDRPGRRILESSSVLHENFAFIKTLEKSFAEILDSRVWIRLQSVVLVFMDWI